MASELTEVVIEGWDEEARGTCTCEGRLLRVIGACPGDRVRVQIVGHSRHGPQAFAEIRDVVERGVDFREPPCPWVYPLKGRCGGCPTMHLTPEAQARFKTGVVKNALAGLTSLPDLQLVPAATPLGYRCRANYVVEERQRTVRLGSYSPRSHEVARMDGCLVVHPTIARLAALLAHTFSRLAVPVHPRPTGLRFVALRSSAAGAIVAELVATSPEAVRWAIPLAEEVVRPGMLDGLSLSINDRDTDAIKIAPATCLRGASTVTDRVGDLVLDLEAGSFSQLNLEVASAMYRRAAQFVRGAKTLWDLYSGSGALGLTVAQQCGARAILGAESVESSVEQARTAAARLGIEARYEARNLAFGPPDNWPLPDAILVNPPRRGLDKAVLDRLAQALPKVVVYMSCHPRSFARDAAALLAAGYRLTDLEAHDMLPQTAHVEIIARFEH